MKNAPQLMDEALRIVNLANTQGIPLRMIGACAIKLHCPNSRDLFQSMERELSDADFVSLREYRNELEKLFKSSDYTSNERFNWLHGRERLIFNSKHGMVVDIFFDKLQMCHVVDFRDRLELDYPTATLADLLLMKMQIVKITEKDLKDVIILLREHSLDAGDAEKIDIGHIAKTLARDWGFYYTVITNLNKTKNYCQNTCEALGGDDKKLVLNRIDKLIKFIEEEPKSMSWRMRAKIGTRKKWYEEPI